MKYRITIITILIITTNIVGLRAAECITGVSSYCTVDENYDATYFLDIQYINQYDCRDFVWDFYVLQGSYPSRVLISQFSNINNGTDNLVLSNVNPNETYEIWYAQAGETVDINAPNSINNNFVFTISTECVYQFDSWACCEDLPNLHTNGNFNQTANLEYLNSEFINNTLSGFPNTTIPNCYSIQNTASITTNIPNWNINDRTDCIENTSNSNFLFFNGSNLGIGSNSALVYLIETNDLEQGKEYRFCFDVKELEQCHFNNQPKLSINQGSNEILSNSVISTSDNPCDWQRIEVSFEHIFGQDLSIMLDRTGFGDGNDFALDNISIHPKSNNDNTITSTIIHHNDHYEINASFDSDYIEQGCEYLWLVGRLNPNDHFAGGSIMLGNQNINWGYNTDFPLYNSSNGYGHFNYNSRYRILLYLYNCPCTESNLQFLDFRIPRNRNRDQKPIKSKTANGKLKTEFTKTVKLDETRDNRVDGRDQN